MAEECPGCDDSNCPRRRGAEPDEEAEQWRRAYFETIADITPVLIALGFDVLFQLDVPGAPAMLPTVTEMLEKIRHLEKCKRLGAQCSEALDSCAEILGVPLENVSTEVPHAVAELRERSDHRAEIILKLQARLL